MIKNEDFKNTKALIKEQEMMAAVIAGILFMTCVGFLAMVVLSL